MLITVATGRCPSPSTMAHPELPGMLRDTARRLLYQWLATMCEHHTDLHKLMCTCHELQPVYTVELCCDAPAKQPPCASRADRPAG
jgi:hypothetical protein